MNRKLIIFGNGLGMALDPNHFSLERSLNDVWCDDVTLDNEQKRLIEYCYSHTGAPNGEDELGVLYEVVNHCQGLSQIGEIQEDHWLTEDGKNFPEATSKYFHKVATDLHLYENGLSENFLSPLTEFIKKSKSHVATLNYDKLLYDAFIDRNVVTSDYYTTKLVDGMLNSGFSSHNLQRLYDNNFGWYLHLHGSPLFYGTNGDYGKYSRYQLEQGDSFSSKHIVLTHFEKKPEVIAASYILSTYWRYLPLAISESEEIIIFGYSGMDKHVNDILQIYAQGKNKRVIEWDGAGDSAERQGFWEQEIGKEVQLEQLDNVLDFKDWE